MWVDGEPRPLPEEQLPLLLPETKNFKPSGSGESPLANLDEWLEMTDPASGKPARRETNTMPQWAGSCWYYLRFIDPKNAKQLVDPEKERYWMPVDLYVGGSEHAVLHLLYAGSGTRCCSMRAWSVRRNRLRSWCIRGSSWEKTTRRCPSRAAMS